MNINIYEKYKVMVYSNSSRLSEENTNKYGNIFVEKEYSDIIKIDGGKLMKIFSCKLEDQYISEFTINGNTYIFEYFNYNNGENWDIQYTILRD